VLAGLAWRGAALAALAAALTVRAADAQERARSGFWLDAGAGYARLRLRCSNCAGIGTARGGTLTMTFGHSLSERAALGLEGQVWSSWESGPREQVRSLTLVAQWYPFRREHLFVRGGTGIVWGPVVQNTSGTQPESVKGTGVGLTLGVGYDVQLGEHIAVAFQAASHVAALGDLDLHGTTLQDTIAYVTRLAVAFVYR
jgi:hypothetical protein